jgi:hypothetical protein
MHTPEPPTPPPSAPQATVWIKVPSLAAGGSETVYMYYGNPTASSASDGNAVFDFFDDFSGDLSKWTVVGGTWAIQNGELDASTAAFGQRLRAYGITFGNGIVEARIKWVSGTYFEHGLCIRGQTDETANSYVYFLSTYSAEKHRLYKRLSSSSIKIAAGDGPNPSQGVWYDIRVSANGNFFAAVTNPTYGEISGTDSSFSSGTFCLFSWAASAEHVHYDNVRIRKYASPEPTTTLGPEERVPWTITFQATGVTVSVTVSYTYDSTTGSITIPVGESVSITVPDGSTLSYVYPSPVSGGDGFQFILKSVSPTSPITVTGDTTVTGTYKTQYLVTFEQTGSGATVHVTYTADTDPIVGVPFSTWVKAGSTLTFSYDAVVNDGQPTRYIFVSVDHTSPLTVNGPITVTATYKAQHYLTVRTDPTGIATIPGGGWYDASTSVSLIAPSVSGYTFQYWDVDGVSQGLGVATITVNMNAAHTATAHYQAIPPSASVPTATGTGTAAFTPDAGYIEDLTALPTMPPGAPAGVTFPHGMFSFKVTGLPTTPPGYPATVTITVTLPSAVPVGTRWYKWHATVGWISLPIGSDNGDNVITITITDNGIGDFNPTAGVILDPGGPGSPPPVGGVWVPINKFQLLAPWVGLASVITLAAVSIVYVKHRKKQRN